MAEVVVVGSINVDLSIAVPHALRRGETLLGSDLTRSGGGKGANQAVACARLGRSTAMVGAVGDDAEGGWMIDLLAAEGVDTRGMRRLPVSTGQAIILVEPDGESTIVVSPGANAGLSPRDLDAVRDSIASARCVLVQQEIAATVVEHAATLTTGLFVLNPAPARPVSAGLLARVDVLVPNRYELAGLCQTSPSDDLDAVAGMARALKGPGCIVVTLGGEGALVVQGDRVVHVPPVQVQPIDTTAAGDTFCAALVDALLDDSDMVEAARWACRVAAMTVGRRGAMDSIPRRADVR